MKIRELQLSWQPPNMLLLPPHPQQQSNSKMIIQLHPPSFDAQPHPVAAKSLM